MSCDHVSVKQISLNLKQVQMKVKSPVTAIGLLADSVLTSAFPNIYNFATSLRPCAAIGSSGETWFLQNETHNE